MTLRRAYPLSNAFLSALRRPFSISRFSPEVLEADLDAFLSFMEDAFGELPLEDEAMLTLVAENLTPVSDLGLALALVCPSDLYLAAIGSNSEDLELELLGARDRE